ncbi:MAG TPA: hypothetical protein VG796_22445 [Verrucomicrobiales bacterium]|nr:hypothetical protein [Verrucomicrobiales bacterium]
MNNTTVIETHVSRLSWRSVFAGAVVALSIHLLLTTLGAGITALVARPSDSPGTTLTIGLALSWTLSALISLWVGGCVAGNLGSAGDRERGMLHGFMVWSAATVIAFVLLATGVGKALGLAGQAVAGTAQAAAAALPNLAQKSAEVIDQYTGEVVPNGKALTPAAKRELAVGLKNYLISDGGRTPQNRQVLITALTAQGVAAPDAEKTVDEWTASFDRARDEVNAQIAAASQKAKEIADRTAVATGAAGIWTFVAFWIGAMAAVWGGKMGAEACHKKERKEHGYPAGRVQPTQV